MDTVSDRIDAMRFSRFHTKLLSILGSAHLFDAYDATALAFILPVLIGLWGLTPGDVGLLLASGYVGQLVGALLASALAERFGRRTMLVLVLTALSISSVACALANGFAALVVFRLLQGMGLGGETPLAAAYLNEMSPKRIRGRMISFIQWMFAIGTVVAALMAPLLVPRFGWQAMFILGASPLLLAAALRRLLPESPAWLAARGRLTEARAALARMGADDGPLAMPDDADGHERRWRALLAAGQAKSTIAAWLIAFCASFTGYGIIGWMPTLYRIVYHVPTETALRYGVFNGAAALAGGVIGVLVIDRLPRKTYLATGFAGCAVALGVLASLGSAATALDAAILSAIAFTFLGMPLAGIYVYAPELYPLRLKALGTGVASAWIRIASIVGPPVIGWTVARFAPGILFVLLAAVVMVGALGTLVLGRETRPRAV